MPTVTVIQPTIAEEKAVKIRCAAYCRVSSDSEDQDRKSTRLNSSHSAKSRMPSSA